MNNSQLYNKNACCGCGACAVVCPKNAISMLEDKYGFVYPSIDSNLCINCGKCKKNCAFIAEKESNEFSCYACANKNNDQILKSASGGAFSAIAYAFLKSGGYVCGATCKIVNGIVKVEHEIISKIEELPKLQGSKYVQSSTIDAFKKIRELIQEGKMVLFSGTPCQVDAIRKICTEYIGKNLFTIDLICHGVPSQKFFNGYLANYQQRKKSQLTYIDFRNKKFGWGLTGLAIFSNNHEDIITPEVSSYYKLFLDGEIYRENCYSCPYANLKRVGDLTIGDYWGIEKYSPDIMMKPNISSMEGVSCLLINNERGKKIIDEYGEGLAMYPVEIEKIMKINTQLREPACHTVERDKILSIFSNDGYATIEKMFQRKKIIRKIKRGIKKIVPKPIKKVLKQLMKKSK